MDFTTQCLLKIHQTIRLYTVQPKHVTCKHAVHKAPTDIHFTPVDLEVMQISALGFTLGFI